MFPPCCLPCGWAGAGMGADVFASRGRTSGRKITAHQPPLALDKSDIDVALMYIRSSKDAARWRKRR